MDRNELLAFWQQAKQGDFAGAYDEAMSKVTTWGWSDGPSRWILPLGRELAPEIGCSFDGEPKKLKEGLFAYGFDAHQNMCVIRQVVDSGAQRPLGDWITIISDRKTTLDWVEYGVSPGRGVRHKAMVVLDQGAIVAHHQVTNSTYLCHRYLRDEDGRVTTIERDQVTSWQAKRRSRRTEVHSILEVSHDLRGVTSIDRLQGEYTYPVYRRPVEGDLEQLVKELEDLLATEVPARAATLALGEPAYDLALVWDEAGGSLPPAIAVGAESERARLAPDGLERAPCEKACFANGPFDFNATGGRLLDLSLTLASILPRDARIELLVRVANRLARVDWSSTLSVTDDFDVYLCDMWGNDVA